MVATGLQREERIGLLGALVVHGAMIAFLVLRPMSGEVVRPPERITVSLSEEVGLVSASPDPFSDAAPDVAPTIGDAPAAEPQVAEVAPPRRTPTAVPEQPRPAPAAVQRPPPVARERSRPDRPAPPVPAARPAPPSRAVPDSRPARRPGGSRLGSDFLEGVPGGTSTQRSGSPRAESIGPAVRSALSGAISRQLKPHWIAPQGVDVELLVTVVAWNLNEDGSLAGQPRIVDKRGITPANRAQADRHAEQAIRAIQLAAPFDLPAEYYDAWKRIQFDFDKSLSR